MLNKFIQMLILAVMMLAAAPLLSLWRSLFRPQTADIDAKVGSFDWDHVKTKKSRQNGIYLSDY